MREAEEKEGRKKEKRGREERGRERGRKERRKKKREGGSRKKTHKLFLQLGYLLMGSAEVFHQYHKLAYIRLSLVWASEIQRIIGEEWPMNLSCRY